MTTKTFTDKENGVVLPSYLKDKTINVGDIIFWEDDVSEMDDTIISIIKNTCRQFGIVINYNANDALEVVKITESIK